MKIIDEEIDAVLTKIDEDCSIKLDGISDHLIPFLPVHIFKTKVNRISLEQKWHLLPHQKRVALEDYLPCHYHYNTLTMKDHVDAPPPSRRNCCGCKKLS